MAKAAVSATVAVVDGECDFFPLCTLGSTFRGDVIYSARLPADGTATDKRGGEVAGLLMRAIMPENERVIDYPAIARVPRMRARVLPS